MSSAPLLQKLILLSSLHCNALSAGASLKRHSFMKQPELSLNYSTLGKLVDRANNRVFIPL